MKSKTNGDSKDTSFGSLVASQTRRALSRRAATIQGARDALSALGARAPQPPVGGLATRNPPPANLAFPTHLIPPLPPVTYAVTPWGLNPWGFFIAYGPPNTGKTVTMLGLAYWMNGIAIQDGTYAYCAYHSVSEPRSQEDTPLANNLSNMPNYVDGAFGTVAGSPRPLVAIIDSVGFAMRMYGTETRGKQGSMALGMDTQDQAFCREMQKRALKLGVLIGIVGATEVPFVEALEGLLEGMITIVEPGVFTITFRAQAEHETDRRARSQRTVQIPAWAHQMALTHLGYGSASAGRESSGQDISTR